MSTTPWHGSLIAPFTRSERWRVAQCDHLRPLARPQTLAHDGQPALNAPLLVRRGVLGLPAHDHLSLNDVGVAAALGAAGLTALLDAQLAGRATLAAFEARRVPDDSPLLAAARQTTDAGGDGRWHWRHVADTAWFDLDGDSVPVPGKLRRNLKRLARELGERGELEVQLVDGHEPVELQSAFQAFLALEATGWKGGDGQGTAIAEHATLVSFYRALIELPDPECVPVIALLTLDGRPLAAQLGLRCEGVLSLLKIAYDESEGRCSPGSQLLLGVLQRSADAGLARVSLVTSPAWAQRWHPHRAPVWHVTRYADSVLGRILHGARDTRYRASAAWRARRHPDSATP